MREQHAVVVTDESLQEEVRRALDVVAKTTKASEAQTERDRPRLGEDGPRGCGETDCC